MLFFLLHGHDTFVAFYSVFSAGRCWVLFRRRGGRPLVAVAKNGVWYRMFCFRQTTSVVSVLTPSRSKFVSVCR